jgi:glycine oxidase
MHAGIVGAGLMGRMLAWRLQQAGWQITLFDKGGERAEQSAAYAAAGMLSPYAELQSGDPLIFRMGQESLSIWSSWLQQIQQPVYFQQRGSLLVAHPEDQSEFQQFKMVLNNKLNNYGDMQKINREWLQQHEPDLNFDEGLFLSQEGQIDTRGLLAALYKILLAKQTNFYFHTVVNRIEPKLIITDGHRHQFDWVFDCRGYGATNTMTDLRNVRGEIIYLHAPEVNITRPVRLLHPRYRLYIVPRPDHVYVVGASEIESDDESPISVRSCLELLSAAYSVHPGFAEARVLETLTAKRAAFSDNLPQLQYQSGLIAVNGLYRHGFLIAPVLTEEIYRLLMQDDLRYPQCMKELVQ